MSLFSNVFAAKKQLSVSNYLQMKFLGQEITYIDPTIIAEDGNPGTRNAVVKEIVLNQKGYHFLTDDQRRVAIKFTLEDGLVQPGQRSVSSDHLRQQALRTEQFINISMAAIGNTESSNASNVHSQYYNDPNNSLLTNSQGQDNVVTEEVSYLNLRTGSKHKGVVTASYYGVYLDTGVLLSLKFVDVSNETEQ